MGMHALTSVTVQGYSGDGSENGLPRFHFRSSRSNNSTAPTSKTRVRFQPGGICRIAVSIRSNKSSSTSMETSFLPCIPPDMKSPFFGCCGFSHQGREKRGDSCCCLALVSRSGRSRLSLLQQTKCRSVHEQKAKRFTKSASHNARADTRSPGDLQRGHAKHRASLIELSF